MTVFIGPLNEAEFARLPQSVSQSVTPRLRPVSVGTAAVVAAASAPCQDTSGHLGQATLVALCSPQIRLGVPFSSYCLNYTHPKYVV